ncbi:pyridoxal phosphate-dependent decarboxylase [Mycena latifolia]|nr:pyridoxal phosphate-dependent decarboxylase [Mycena latifolia]
METHPVGAQVDPGYLRKSLPLAAPFLGEDFQDIADDYQKLIIPGLTNWQHPSFFGYFPAACTWEGILGDLYAGSLFSPGFNWISSPAATELEITVMDWVAQMFGLSHEFQNSSSKGGGVLQATASESVLVAMVAARTRYLHEHPEADSSKLLVYVSPETHSVGLKTALILGIQARVLEVEIVDNLELRGRVFSTALEQDRIAGRHPFFLLATVGTTSSGAIDRIHELGIVATGHNIWLHIDAAWAGVALVCPEFRELCQLEAINRYADSFCTNLHKWGIVSGSASALWVKQLKYVTDALDVTPAYLSAINDDSEDSPGDGSSSERPRPMLDMRHWKFGLATPFRALKVWFVLRSFGVHGFQKHIRNGAALNSLFVARVQKSPVLALVTPPALSLTVVRLEPRGMSFTPDELNLLNKSWYTRLAQRADLFVTSTVVSGIYCVRFVVGAERTMDTHVLCTFEIFEEEAQVALEKWNPNTATVCKM